MVVVSIVTTNHAISKAPDLLLHVSIWAYGGNLSFCILNILSASHVLLLSQNILIYSRKVHIYDLKTWVLLDYYELHIIKKNKRHLYLWVVPLIDHFSSIDCIVDIIFHQPWLEFHGFKVQVKVPLILKSLSCIKALSSLN